MRSLGLDIGGKRTGVAISDAQGILAMPLTVLASDKEEALVDEILKLAEQHKVQCIVVGLPRCLSGEVGKQARKVTAFVDKLLCQAKECNLSQLEVRFWDERFSTRAAEQLKAEASGRRSKQHSRAERGSVSGHSRVKARTDAIAAAFILQGFLDSRRVDKDQRP